MIISMIIFSLSMSISPGPVNVLALTNGLNHGFKASLKFILGATVGFTLLLFLIGYGLSAIHSNIPIIVRLLKLIGCGYLIYVAVKIYSDDGEINAAKQTRAPLTFIQGCLMQWLNPKAWVACVAGCAAFNIYTSNQRLALFLVIYFILCFIGISIWAALGNKMTFWIKSKKHVSLFNQFMGVTLCVLAIFLLTHK